LCLFVNLYFKNTPKTYQNITNIPFQNFPKYTKVANFGMQSGSPAECSRASGTFWYDPGKSILAKMKERISH
jgi:hypothetical protein